MSLKKVLSNILIVLAGLILISCVSEPQRLVEEPRREEVVETDGPVEIEPAQPLEQRRSIAQAPTVGCDTGAEMTKAQRIDAVNEAVVNAEKELMTNPNVLNDSEARARVGTFAAGTMADSVPFVSIDRECWASFYEAQNALNAGKDAESAKAADDWEVCLRANYESRLPLARPYFSCFAKSTAPSGK